MPAYFNIGAGYQEGAWHGEMKVFEDILTPKEAFAFCGMNEVQYELQPARSTYVMPNGEVVLHKIDNRYDLWRSPTSFDPVPRFIRTVGNRYDPIQPAYLADILTEPAKTFHVDTCGILSDWSLAYMTLKMEPFAVGGFEQEEHQSWLLVSDDKSKVGSAYWGNVIERVVCRNTYNAAMSSARNMHAIPHNTDVALELAFRSDLLVSAIRQREEIVDAFDAMIRRIINKDQYETMLNGAFPWTKEPRELELVRMVPEGAVGDAITDMRERAEAKQEWLDQQNDFVNRQRNEATSAFEQFNDEFPYAANTVYAGFNSVTWQINHGKTYKGSAAKQQISVMFGDRANAMGGAFRVAKELISEN